PDPRRRRRHLCGRLGHIRQARLQSRYRRHACRAGPRRNPLHLALRRQSYSFPDSVMRFTSVLFDLDGTLLNTIPDLTDGVNGMRMALGLPPLRQDIVSTYVGKGSEVLVRRALQDNLRPEEPIEPPLLAQGMELFYQYYRTVNGDKTVIYEGVLEGLKAFREQGVKMAVVTNKPEAFTEHLLVSTGQASFFEHAVSVDTCERKKPDPLPLHYACKLLHNRPQVR